MPRFDVFGWLRKRGQDTTQASGGAAGFEGMPVTTTHDVHGGGRPRLVIVRSDHPHDDMPQTFDLRPGTSRIGAHPNADVRLHGVADHHAEVRRDTADEYVFVHVDPKSGSTVNGREVTEMTLHTGDRIMFGGWTLAYARAESADHGRPHGGRAGGERSHQRHQTKPRQRGTSPAGGSEPTAEDPGEYY